MNRKSQQTREHARQTHRTYRGGFPAMGVHRPCGFLSRPFRSVLLCLAAAFAAGPATAQDPTMDQLWPNTDGLSWTYDQAYEDYFQQESVQNQVRFYFKGTTIVPGGIEVQNLKSEVFGGADRLLKTHSDLAGAPEAVGNRGPFWRNLWRARPDLRESIESSCANNATDSGSGWPYSILLHAGTYVKTDEEISSYRTDQVAMKSWLYLISDLTIGATFDLQLIPDIAVNVWLHGTLAAREDVTVPAGTFAGCLRVDYRIDYGETVCTDEQGQVSGSMRSETRGSIHYATGVGPVRVHERMILFAEPPSGECSIPWPVGEPVTECGLSLTNSQPTPVEEMSWGRLKHHYRDATR